MAASKHKSDSRRDGLVELVVDDESRRRAPIGKALGLILLTVLGFALGLSGVRNAGPDYLDLSRVRARFHVFAAHKDDIELLVFGNSRMRHHIDCKLLEEELAKLGTETACFNFGIGSLNSMETQYVLDAVLATRPEKLRWVVLDPGDMRTGVRTSNLLTERFINWHDLERTRGIVELIENSGIAKEKQELRVHDHLLAFARRTSNYGRGVLWIKGMGEGWEGWLAKPSKALRHYRWHVEHLEENQGFARLREPLARGMFPDPETAVRLMASVEKFRQQGRTAMTRDFQGLELARREHPRFTEGERAFVGKLQSSITSSGYKAIFMLNPRPDTRGDYLRRAKKAGAIDVLLDYGSTKTHRNLFRTRHRFERSHLNSSAAADFTTTLAADLAPHLKKD